MGRNTNNGSQHKQLGRLWKSVQNLWILDEEPWQATAFALAVQLSAEGHFTWKEWAATLAGELKVAAEHGEADDGSRYYHCWLAALERLVVTKGLSDSAALLARKEAWADAYRHTPHGKPVELDIESGA